MAFWSSCIIEFHHQLVEVLHIDSHLRVEPLGSWLYVTCAGSHLAPVFPSWPGGNIWRVHFRPVKIVHTGLGPNIPRWSAYFRWLFHRSHDRDLEVQPGVYYHTTRQPYRAVLEVGPPSSELCRMFVGKLCRTCKRRGGGSELLLVCLPASWGHAPIAGFECDEVEC